MPTCMTHPPIRRRRSITMGMTLGLTAASLLVPSWGTAAEPATTKKTAQKTAEQIRQAAAQVAVSPLSKNKPSLPTVDRNQPREAVRLKQDAAGADVHGKSFDVVVVGGTAGGVACAVRAAREGCSVLLVHHHHHIGGMMSNGLMQWDALYGGPRAPLFTELLGNIETHYRTHYGDGSPDHQTSRYTHEHYPISWVEPHVAEREFNRLLAGEKNLTLLLGHYPVSVEKKDTLILSATFKPLQLQTPKLFEQAPEAGRTENKNASQAEPKSQSTGEVRTSAKTFVDATYEGDLFALAEVPFRVGREARDEYQEPHAGKVFANIGRGPAPKDAAEGRLNIRAYSSKQGTIDPTSPYTADGCVQAYNYRFCVTRDPANRLPIPKPASFNRDEYLKFKRRYIAASGGPNQKSHVNSPILPGENHDYPEADWPTREKIIRRHLDFGLGLMWFLQNDPSIPADQREKFSIWGLPKDEFADHSHVPYEMYVREARRIVGRHVFTEHDNSLAPGLGRTPIHADSVAVTDWYMDSHSCTLDSRPGFEYDGKLILTEESRPAQIPYRSLLPKNVDNLLVPVCLSTTHISWGAVRLEPVWMQTGEAAGWAAALAKQTGVPPADLKSDALVRKLVQQRHLISFFNDVKVDADGDAIPASQYFGAHGFFADYDARLDDFLTVEVARVWSETYLDIARDVRLRPHHAAQRVLTAEKMADQDESMIKGRFSNWIDQPIPPGASPDAPLTRGEALAWMWKSLNAR